MDKRIGIVIGNCSVTSCMGANINPHAADILAITEYDCIASGVPVRDRWRVEQDGFWRTQTDGYWNLEV